MNAPLPKGRWSSAALSTVRAYGQGMSRAGEVLDALRYEDWRAELPLALREDFAAADRAAEKLARTALAMVLARDASIFGAVAVETAPAPANDSPPPTVFDINAAALAAGARNVVVSRMFPTSFRVDCSGFDGEQRESLRLLLTETFPGAQFCVEER